MRDLVGIKCCLVLSGVELQMVISPNAGSPTLLASGRQISGHLPVSGSIENQLTRIPSLSSHPHLMSFVARLFAVILVSASQGA